MESYKILSENQERQKKTIRNKEQVQQIENSKNMVDINPIISIITLNVNDLNAPIERQMLSEWIKKQDPGLPWWCSG